jgi:hypothetical protein
MGRYIEMKMESAESPAAMIRDIVLKIFYAKNLEGYKGSKYD